MKKFFLTYERLQWIIILLTFVVDLVWIKLGSFAFYYSKRHLFILAILLISLYVPYLFYKKFRPDQKIMAALLSTFFFMSFTAGAGVLSYLAYTTNRPLIAPVLATLDSYLGIYTPAIVFWFWRHEWMNILFTYIYESFFFQNFFILIYLSFRERISRLQQFIIQYMFAALLSLFVGALFPAEGTYAYYHFAPNAIQVGDLHSLYQLRQNIVDIRHIHGIVTLPSFHTAMALIYIYSFRDENKIIFIPFLFLNSLLVFSCVSHGGHFFVDILAGGIISLMAVGIELLISQYVRQTEFTKQKHRNT